MSGIGIGHGAEDFDPLVPEAVGVRPHGRLRGDQSDDLQQVVLHDIPQCSHRVVEAAAILHAEVLGHGDLDTLNAVPVPQGLDDGVGEPEEQDVHGRLLAQEVIDAQDLPLIEQFAQLGVQLAGGRQVVAERLLDDDPRLRGQAGGGKAVHDPAEQRGRDLEVEDGTVPAGHRRGHPLVGGRVGVVAGHHRQAGRQPLEHLLVEILATVHDGTSCVVAEHVVRPLVAGDTDDRT